MISAVLPVFRGQPRLERNLPSVLAALGASGEDGEIVVVDDGGGGVTGLPDGVRLVSLPENRGYGPAVNAGVAVSGGDRLLVLNDDVHLEQGAVRRLREVLAPGIFAVVPAIESPLAACGDEGGKRGVWRGGMLEIEEVRASQVHSTLYPVGCCFLCQRQDFLALGGYDELFAPFFWEDVDLGFRAWRHGLRILHVPDAVCQHQGSATLGEQRSYAERERIEFRHRVLFHLRNLEAPASRAANLGAWVAHALFDGSNPRRDGLVEALERYAAAGPRPPGGLSDAAILARASGP